MIFNDDIIFIHIGKTGGSSCAEYLLNTLRPTVFNCNEDARREQETFQRRGVVAIPQVHRHVTLEETLIFLRKYHHRTLDDFSKVLVVVRHPYTLEFSFYNHLRKPDVRRRRRNDKRLLELADGDFKAFVAEADHHRRGMPQEAFFRLHDEIPDCVEFVRFEEIETGFPRAAAQFVERSYPFPHRLKTRYETSVEEVLDDETRALLYRKHRFMFDAGFYSQDIPSRENDAGGRAGRVRMNGSPEIHR